MLTFVSIVFARLACVLLLRRRRMRSRRAGQARSARRTISDSREGSNNQKDWHFIGHVEMERGSDTKIYADDVEMLHRREPARSRPATSSSRRATTASPPSAPSSTPRRGSARSTTRSGIATRQAAARRRRGPAASRRRRWPARRPIVYFFGETIEKIGPKKYRITNGGFSTCVQPTPRWDLHAGTVVLNVDHYTLLKNAVLQREGRADVLPADPVLPDQAGRTAPPAS